MIGTLTGAGEDDIKIKPLPFSPINFWANTCSACHNDQHNQ